MDKPIYAPGQQVRKFCFRYHPNNTTDVDPRDPDYAVNASEVESIVYSATGKHCVTLKNRHTKILGVSARFQLETDPGLNTEVRPYGIVDGMSATNLFYLVTCPAGTAAAVSYAITTWIYVEVTVEEQPNG